MKLLITAIFVSSILVFSGFTEVEKDAKKQAAAEKLSETIEQQSASAITTCASCHQSIIDDPIVVILGIDDGSKLDSSTPEKELIHRIAEVRSFAGDQLFSYLNEVISSQINQPESDYTHAHNSHLMPDFKPDHLIRFDSAPTYAYGMLKMAIELEDKMRIQLVVSSLRGEIVYRTESNLTTTHTQIKIDDLQLQSGIYIVTINTPEKKISRKFVVPQ